MGQIEVLNSLGYQTSPAQSHELTWRRVPHPGDRNVRFHDEAILDLQATPGDCFSFAVQEDIAPTLGNSGYSAPLDELGAHRYRGCCGPIPCRLAFSRWGDSAPRRPGGIVHATVQNEPGRTVVCNDDAASFQSFAWGNAPAWQRCRIEPGADGGNVVVEVNGAIVARRPKPADQYESCARWETAINGECARREVMQLIFWRNRLYGVVFYPIGRHELDTEAARAGGRAAYEAIQRRLGAGRESQENCEFVNDNNEPCTLWQDAETDFAFGHRRFMDREGLDEVVVAYRCRAMLAERQGLIAAHERTRQNAAQTAISNQADSIGSRF